jgi:hypothetical protein
MPDLNRQTDKHGRITYANQFNIRGDGCMLSETHATAWVILDTRALQARSNGLGTRDDDGDSRIG